MRKKAITIFSKLSEPGNPKFVTIGQALDRIKNGEDSKLVAQIRSAKDKVKRRALKKQLPCILFSGKFPYRNEASLENHSGFICIDFDHFEGSVEEYKKEVATNNVVFAAFVSPSGDGLKVIVRVPEGCDVVAHREHFLALSNYFALPGFDFKCVDASRICFSSFDPDIYINKKATIFTKRKKEKKRELSLVKIQQNPDANETTIFEGLKSWMNREGEIFGVGNMSNFIYKLACACNRFGLNINFVENAILYDFPPKDDREAVGNVRRAFSQHKAEFGTQRYNTKPQRVEQPVPKPASAPEPEKGTNTPVEEVEAPTTPVNTFWDIHSNNRKRVVIEFSRLRFLRWLSKNGFFRYCYAKNQYTFIRIIDNVVTEVWRKDLKKFTFDYLENLPENLEDLDGISKEELYEFVAGKVRDIFGDEFLELVKERVPNWNKDKRNCCFLYFKNSVVMVTPKHFEILEYSELSGCVWNTQIIDREFSEVENNENDFSKFAFNIAGKEILRYDSLRSIFGYLIHGYKDKAYPPAVIFTDVALSDRPEGGTGKGLVAQALAQYLESVPIDGKAWNGNRSFPFQRAGLATKLVIFDDVQEGFDFARLFSVITEGMTVEYKNKPEFFIPFEESPKILINANVPVQGEGSSHRRRRVEFEFAQHYYEGFNPFDDFGRVLFEDWNEEEFNRFDNWTVEALQLFLKTYAERRTVLEPESINLALKKFMGNTCKEFAVFAVGNITFNQRIDRKILKSAFVKAFPDFHGNLTTRTFNGWVSYYAEYRNVTPHEQRSGNTLFVSLQGTPKDRPEIIELCEEVGSTTSLFKEDPTSSN